MLIYNGNWLRNSLASQLVDRTEAVKVATCLWPLNIVHTSDVVPRRSCILPTEVGFLRFLVLRHAHDLATS